MCIYKSFEAKLLEALKIEDQLQRERCVLLIDKYVLRNLVLLVITANAKLLLMNTQNKKTNRQSVAALMICHIDTK